MKVKIWIWVDDALEVIGIDGEKVSYAGKLGMRNALDKLLAVLSEVVVDGKD